MDDMPKGTDDHEVASESEALVRHTLSRRCRISPIKIQGSATQVKSSSLGCARRAPLQEELLNLHSPVTEKEHDPFRSL